MVHIKRELELQLVEIEKRLECVFVGEEHAILQLAKANILIGLQKYEVN